MCPYYLMQAHHIGMSYKLHDRYFPLDLTWEKRETPWQATGRMSVTQPMKTKSNTKRLNPGVANQRKREREEKCQTRTNRTWSTILCLRTVSLSSTFMATLSPVSVFCANFTLAKVPSPIVRPTSYLPTFLITIFFTTHTLTFLQSNGLPLLAQQVTQRKIKEEKQQHHPRPQISIQLNPKWIPIQTKQNPPQTHPPKSKNLNPTQKWGSSTKQNKQNATHPHQPNSRFKLYSSKQIHQIQCSCFWELSHCGNKTKSCVNSKKVATFLEKKWKKS